MHQYGIDIAEVENFIGRPNFHSTEYGSHSTLASTSQYRLEQFVLYPGKRLSLGLGKDEEATLFAEEGSVQINNAVLERHTVATLPPSSSMTQTALEKATIYAFYGRAEGQKTAIELAVKAPGDYRDKYWGSIQTVLNKTYTGKRLFFRRGQHSSLHFHCRKSETYFIHSGELYLRLRAGRGEDRFFTLHAGDTLFIPPGLMHQDGGLTDTVIIEISTHDEDTDSFIVEDGATKRMPGLPS